MPRRGVEPVLRGYVRRMEIAGLPLHPLAVHATVVFVPLAALSAIVFALVPRWRWLTRWATVALSVLAVGFTYLSTTTGEALAEARPGVESLIEEHQELGELLANSLVGFTALVLFAAWSLAGPTALASGRGNRESKVPALERVTPGVMALASVGILVLVVLVGDSGARSVWAG